MVSTREHDIVIFGATGFVGKLTALYLREAAAGVKVALGGRSRAKLERVRDELGVDWPLVVGDSHDAGDMAALAASAKVVATTVGPYAKYGLPLAEACAAAGTHYADLTGETLFMRRVIDACHARAVESGARIVHTCGFDSIPSDIGVLLLHEHAKANRLGELGKTDLVVTGTRGGLSGGTLDSARNQIDEVRADKALRKVVFDPYGLSPDRAADPKGADERDPLTPVRDPELGGWYAPFVMGPVNTRVVRRSNALLGHAYGAGFRYRELIRTGDAPLGPVIAGAISGGIAAVFAGMSLPPTRKLLDRVLPDPGEGPDEEKREKGFFKISTYTTTSSGARLVCRIAAQGDPGYKATAVMLGESALALAADEKLPAAAGVLTPATAMGTVLADRLRAAGHTYEVESL